MMANNLNEAIQKAWEGVEKIGEKLTRDEWIELCDEIEDRASTASMAAREESEGGDDE